MKIRSLAPLLALSLAACGLFPSAAERAEQKTPQFRAGYSDGCAAASATGVNPRQGLYRDQALYNSNRAYRAGWGSGYSLCRRQTGAAPNLPVQNPTFNPSPGH